MATAPIAERTAQAVSQAVVAAGATISGLADEIGVPYSTLRRKLRGQSPLDVTDIFAIAQAIGVRPSTLLPAEFAPAAVSA